MKNKKHYSLFLIALSTLLFYLIFINQPTEREERIHHNLLLWLTPFEHIEHGHFFVGLLSIIFWVILIIFFNKLCTLFYYKKPTGINSHNTFSFSRKFLPVIISFFVFVSVAYAMCPGIIAPPQRSVMPDDNTHALLVYDFISKIEHLIIEPAFHGNAKDFGMIMPIPSKPELLEANEKIFKELEDLTNPLLRGDFVTTQSASAKGVGEGVTIIEVKDVGDFTAIVLTANDTNSLVNWIEDNNYAYKTADKENYDYYVKRGGYFFVALKVNMEKAKVNDEGNIKGKLRPIEFVFQSSEPMLPIRIMRGDMEDMSFILYTLSDAPYYVPGTKVVFSRRLENSDFNNAPTLKKYGEVGDWLVRSAIRFKFTSIRTDLFLERGDNTLIVRNPSQFKIVNPTLLSEDMGILLNQGPELYIGNERIKNDLRMLFNSMDKIRNDSIALLDSDKRIIIELKDLSAILKNNKNTFEEKLSDIQKKYESRIFLSSIVIGVLIGILVGIVISFKFDFIKRNK